MSQRNPRHSLHRVLSLVMRRMRAPLIVLICAYAIAVLGMVLVPGVDDEGNVWHMDFFHAFYFASYMATTIGFGEIPYEFSDAQRLWATICIYLSVVSWLYAIGKILGLIQDPTFQKAVTENHFQRQVRRIKEPFYLICGYGETGTLVAQALTQRGLRAVAIDIRQERINDLRLNELDLFVPGLCGDAGEPENLRAAGLESPHCAAVLALTDSDNINLKVAITAKLLNPSVRVICRAESKATQDNMASFGTEHIINPFEAFAAQLAIALHSPDMHLIFEWLTALPKTPLAERADPPHGHWIICGYGRFGKAVHKHLQSEGLRCTIIEATPEKVGCPDHCIRGKGTEAVTLLEADIQSAVGIVAGTDDDTDNLSILMTAKDLHPGIYTVARQNTRSNDIIFEAADIDLVMQHADILTLKILALVTAPLLSDFLRLVKQHDNAWARRLLERLSPIAEGIVPDIWTITIEPETTPALAEALEEGKDIRLGHVVTDPGDRGLRLPCLPLLLKRDGHFLLLPDTREALQAGDQILFCGRYGAQERMQWTLNNVNVLHYIETGTTRPDGLVWRAIACCDDRPDWPGALDERKEKR